jgi:hypothetical protein
MSESRGLLLIASFAAVWGAFAGIAAVVWKLVTGAQPGVAGYAVAVALGLLGAVGLFAVLDARRAPRTPPPAEQDVVPTQQRAS